MTDHAKSYHDEQWAIYKARVIKLLKNRTVDLKNTTGALPVTQVPSGIPGSRLGAGTVTPTELSFDPATQAELDAHAADTTSVHGIADTSLLLDTGDLTASHNHTSSSADGGPLTNDEHDGYSVYAEIAAPSSPAANTARLYSKDVAGVTEMFYKNSAGTERDLSASGGGSGTVTSVGLSLPSSILTVSGSPVTTSGTLSATLAGQVNNVVWAGATIAPDSGDPPAFRALVIADIPNLPATKITSGTLALARGGTGASLADPNADRIMFWDDSAGAVDWLTAGTGLTITGTTINASVSSPFPTIAQFKTSTTTATSIVLDQTPTVGNRLILFSNATTGQITSVASTNTTWTQIKTYTSGGSSFYAIWVGVVGSSPSATITFTKPGAFNTVGVIEVTDALTPTLGQNATTSSGVGTSIAGVTAGHFVIACAGPDNTTLKATSFLSIPYCGPTDNLTTMVVGYAVGYNIFASLASSGSAALILAEIT